MNAMAGGARPARHGAPAADLAGRSAQPAVAASALALLAVGAIGLSVRFGSRHGALFLVGGALGFVLHQAAFGFTMAFRAFAADGDGRGVRAQLVMLALATVVFAPILASGAEQRAAAIRRTSGRSRARAGARRQSWSPY